MGATQLLGAVRAIAQLRQHVDQFAALAAGEVAHRSRRELGHQGMAQKAGFVSPVAMIQSEAQVSKHEATRLVEMGTLLAGVEASRNLVENLDETSTRASTLRPCPATGPSPAPPVLSHPRGRLCSQTGSPEVTCHSTKSTRSGGSWQSSPPPMTQQSLPR